MNWRRRRVRLKRARRVRSIAHHQRTDGEGGKASQLLEECLVGPVYFTAINYACERQPLVA